MKAYWRLAASLLILIALFFGWHGLATAPAATAQIHGHTLRLEYADTPAQQEKGLGGRDTLPAEQAMLFRFKEAAQQCFWMKDMRFSLDIIWLDAAKKVVHIEPDLSPATYPRDYCPAEPAQYVLEANAGTTQAFHLKVGDSISF